MSSNYNINLLYKKIKIFARLSISMAHKLGKGKQNEKSDEL